MRFEAQADSGGLPRFEVRGSHLDLLEPLETLAAADPRTAGRGVVVVPTARHVNALLTSITIAAELRWPLLVLCSHGVRAPEVRNDVRFAAGGAVHLVAGNVAPGGSLHAPRPWAVPGHPAAEIRHDIDTNRKRNLALASAAMTGHDWVLFVDDDVLDLDVGDIHAGLSHLAHSPRHHLVGWPMVDFPDNSVVHHARRTVLGKEQSCFVGGAVLLVRLTGRVPAGFPPVYNEDWLFLYDALERREVVKGRDVGQIELDVWAAGRAGREEFGDVLAEGLYHLLHVDAPVETAQDPGYWHEVRRQRARLHARIVERLRELRGGRANDPLVDQRFRALDQARHELTRTTPESLADFVVRWRRDHETWEDLYSHLPPRETLKEALVYLGLHESWIVTT